MTILPHPDAAALVRSLNGEIGFVVATEEALSRTDLRPLATWVQAQPAWSDLPFVILTAHGGGPERNPEATRMSELLGNVTFLERPFHPTTFVSVARTAIRGRSRQFEAKARIEELRDNEEKLRHLNETLEERVAQRTGALNAAHKTVLQEMTQRQRAEDQLRQSQKMEAIGQITGGVAHDFNNLLLAVLANLDLLRHRVAAADAEAMQMIEGAVQAANRGTSLTQRLLAFGRRQTLRVEPTDLLGLVSGMMGLIERSLGSGCELELKLRPGLPRAMVDANQLELALLNLLVNARDAMPDGGTVTVELAQCVAADEGDLVAGDYLCLSVTDTGHGMDAQTLRRAVDPFFSTKEPGKGTGLGLSMIDGLAKQLHGRLSLTSQPGRGTRAELWLPASRAAGAPAAEPPLSPPVPAAPVTQLAVLFVEDDVLIAMATSSMLKKLGHRVTEARSGQQALAAIEKGTHFDLMITDYSMPKMTGMQLAEAVRRLRPTLPIVLATGYAELPSEATLDLPRLDKPYMLKELAAMIGSVVRPKTG
ncbi:response regulator [Roseomonas terrae]|uniref:histidine kinase n=2 Tax=Neoroseomonas terrae TaxID=424799 RepID=A0ABS5EQG1_9PROT|nr:response regulator [Neoroseomonas terrae]